MWKAVPFEYQHCVLQKEVRLKTARLISADVSEGSRSAQWREAFAFAIDSSTNTPHAGWKSMLSGGCERCLCFLTANSHGSLEDCNYFYLLQFLSLASYTKKEKKKKSILTDCFCFVQRISVHSSHNESIISCAQQRTWKRSSLLVWCVCIVVFFLSSPS